MTQPEQAVGGADDTVVTAEPTLEDRFAAIAEQADEPEDHEPEGRGQPEADEPLPEEDAIADEIEVSEEELPSIAPPVSWTAEEKEEFTQLPRTLQETLTRREAEREKFVQTKAQEAKGTQHKVELQAMEVINQMQNSHAQALLAMLPAIPDEPSAHLQHQNPYQYAELMDARRNALAQHSHVQQVLQQIEHQQTEAARAAEAQQQQLEDDLLQEQFPELLDPEKGTELRNSLKSTARELGYSDDRIAQASAHDYLAMKKASEWKAKAEKLDTLMARQMEKVREAKKLPKVSRPGVAQGKGAIDGQRYASDREAMRRGDRDAEARVFSRFL